MKEIVAWNYVIIKVRTTQLEQFAFVFKCVYTLTYMYGVSLTDPTKKGSDIIERISESRRQRHDAALEDMHQELGLISTVSRCIWTLWNQYASGLFVEKYLKSCYTRPLIRVMKCIIICISSQSFNFHKRSCINILWMMLPYVTWYSYLCFTEAQLECLFHKFVVMLHFCSGFGAKNPRDWGRSDGSLHWKWSEN